MGIKEIIQNRKEKKEMDKELFKRAAQQKRINELLEARDKSSNERELERYMKEDHEKKVKKALDFYRKKRQKDINFGHNPLNVPNIMKGDKWSVLKEPNLFKGNKNIFVGNKNIHRTNPSLLKNNSKLYGI